MKAALQAVTGDLFAAMEERKVIDKKNVPLLGDVTISQLDLVGLVMSVASTAFYVWSKSWVYNNILAVVFCVHAL